MLQPDLSCKQNTAALVMGTTVNATTGAMVATSMAGNAASSASSAGSAAGASGGASSGGSGGGSSPVRTWGLVNSYQIMLSVFLLNTFIPETI